MANRYERATEIEVQHDLEGIRDRLLSLRANVVYIAGIDAEDEAGTASEWTEQALYAAARVQEVISSVVGLRDAFQNDHARWLKRS